jgi:hypothetical protein
MLANGIIGIAPTLLILFVKFIFQLSLLVAYLDVSIVALPHL